MSDVDVIDDLVFALLEAAGRKLCVPSWPEASPPPKSPDVPTVEARRDDDGALGVFRFTTIVADDVEPRPFFEMRARDVRAALGLGEDVVLSDGDEVGVELPLEVLCAIALADVDIANGVDLPRPLQEELASSGLRDAVIARLTLLRGTPPSSPELAELRALVTRHGGDVVRWTMSVQAVDRLPAPDPDRLVVHLVRDGVARLLVVSAVRGQGPRRQLLAAMAPQPSPRSLWRFLVERGLFPGPLQGESGGERVSIEIAEVSIDDTPTPERFGVVRATGRRLRWQDGAVVDDAPLSVTLPVDPAGLFCELDDAACARVTAAAAVYARRLSVAPDRLDGSALLRVLARAARGVALEPRGNTELTVEGDDEGAFVVEIGDRALRLVPSEDVLQVRFEGRFVDVWARGRLCDGDVEALRAVCRALSSAIADTDIDVELVFVDDDGAERCQLLSAWLTAQAEQDVIGWIGDARAAAALQDVVDVLLDER